MGNSCSLLLTGFCLYLFVLTSTFHASEGFQLPSRTPSQWMLHAVLKDVHNEFLDAGQCIARGGERVAATSLEKRDEIKVGTAFAALRNAGDLIAEAGALSRNKGGMELCTTTLLAASREFDKSSQSLDKADCSPLSEPLASTASLLREFGLRLMEDDQPEVSCDAGDLIVAISVALSRLETELRVYDGIPLLAEISGEIRNAAEKFEQAGDVLAGRRNPIVLDELRRSTLPVPPVPEEVYFWANPPP